MEQRPSEPGYVPPTTYEDVTQYEPYPETTDPLPTVDYEPDYAHQSVSVNPGGTRPNLPQAWKAMAPTGGLFDGRLDRATFWLGTLGIVGSLSVVAILVAVALIVFGVAFGSGAAAITAGIGGGLLLLGGLWSFLALLGGGVRRLHDTGLPGWALALWLVPFGWIAVVFLLSRPGQRRRNLYGGDPEAR